MKSWKHKNIEFMYNEIYVEDCKIKNKKMLNGKNYRVV